MKSDTYASPINDLIKEIEEYRTKYNKPKDENIAPLSDYVTSKLPKLPSTWAYLSSNDISTFITNGVHTPKSDEDVLGINKRMLRITDIDELGVTDFSNLPFCKRFVQGDYEKTLKKDDIYISFTGNVLGKRYLVRENKDNVVFAHYFVRWQPIVVEPKYIYYVLLSKHFENFMHAYKLGSTQPNLKVKDLKKVPLPIAPLPTQKKIAHILSTLDDKIELNRKMNQTLEEMAQALFKSWFVDFDPVHAKMGCANDEELEVAARELGISKEVLELFPSEFEESELGMIPEGWKIKPLDQVAYYQNGLALQKFRPKDENNFLPVLKIAQLKKGYADDEEKADVDIKPECIVYDGDVIFSWSGSLVVDIWCGGKVALNQHLFKVTSADYAKWFYYLWTKQHLENFQRVAAAKAVTMGHIKRSHLAEALCIVPDELVFEMAEQQISPLIEKLIINRLENKNLQKTRDTLLPKLLSGEIDV